MKSNFNVDIKFNADKVLDVLSTGLRKYTDKIAGAESGGSGRGKVQASRGDRDSYGTGTQSKGGGGRRGGR